MCVCLQFISVLKVITVPSILWEALHCNINMQMNANPGHKKYSFYHGGEPVHFSSPSLSLNAEEFLTQSRAAALGKCTALKQFIADMITLKLPQFIYDIRISLDNYWL